MHGQPPKGETVRKPLIFSEGLVFGYMGVRCNADDGTVTTRSALERNEWAQIADLPLWDGTIGLRHEGRTHSTIVNMTGRTICWNARFGEKSVRSFVLPGQTAEVGI